MQGLRDAVKRIMRFQPWVDPDDKVALALAAQELARCEAAAAAAAEALLNVSACPASVSRFDALPARAAPTLKPPCRVQTMGGGNVGVWLHVALGGCSPAVPNAAETLRRATRLHALGSILRSAASQQMCRLQEETAKAEAAAAAREKKAAKRARRKERDAAVKAVDEPLPAAAIVDDAAATKSHLPAASSQPGTAARHPQTAASSLTSMEAETVLETNTDGAVVEAEARQHGRADPSRTMHSADAGLEDTGQDRSPAAVDDDDVLSELLGDLGISRRDRSHARLHGRETQLPDRTSAALQQSSASAAQTNSRHCIPQPTAPSAAPAPQPAAASLAKPGAESMPTPATQPEMTQDVTSALGLQRAAVAAVAPSVPASNQPAVQCSPTAGCAAPHRPGQHRPDQRRQIFATQQYDRANLHTKLAPFAGAGGTSGSGRGPEQRHAVAAQADAHLLCPITRVRCLRPGWMVRSYLPVHLNLVHCCAVQGASS